MIAPYNMHSKNYFFEMHFICLFFLSICLPQVSLKKGLRRSLEKTTVDTNTIFSI